MSEITAPLNRARVSEMEYSKEMANNGTEIRRAFELMKQAIAHTHTIVVLARSQPPTASCHW